MIKSLREAILAFIGILVSVAKKSPKLFLDKLQSLWFSVRHLVGSAIFASEQHTYDPMISWSGRFDQLRLTVSNGSGWNTERPRLSSGHFIFY